MSDTTARCRANWQEEIESAALYATLAEIERNQQLATVSPSARRRRCCPSSPRAAPAVRYRL